MSDSVAVVFLARGMGGGLPATQAFLESYQAHPAGAPHGLLVLRKGYEDPAEFDAVGRLATQHGARLLDLPDDGFDWAAYLRAAECVDNTWLVLFNTHSRLNRAGWLAHFLAASALARVGAVGATGSWQSLAPGVRIMWPQVRMVAANRTLAHGVAEALEQFWAMARTWPRGRDRDFPLFPNAHLRSNGIMVRRTMLSEFGSTRRLPTSKMAACRLESGRRGLSQYVLSQGLGLRLVGADGAAYAPEAWATSGTFRQPGQPNLLISDNQTRSYAAANDADQRALEIVTWGRPMVEPNSIGGPTRS
jgi:hypothetical protein